jgi:simple sugar transport system ATP-binding protein
VDIGARQDIGRRLRETAAGRATLVICTDLDEAIEVADRIVVMRGFSIAGSHSIEGISLDKVIFQMSSVHNETSIAQ